MRNVCKFLLVEVMSDGDAVKMLKTTSYPTVYVCGVRSTLTMPTSASLVEGSLSRTSHVTMTIVIMIYGCTTCSAFGRRVNIF